MYSTDIYVDRDSPLQQKIYRIDVGDEVRRLKIVSHKLYQVFWLQETFKLDNKFLSK